MSKYRIGQIIKASKDYEIKSIIGGKEISVKENDKAVITSRGSIRYINGQAKDMIQNYDGIELDGYAHRDISELIFKRLNNIYGIADMLEQEDISPEEIIDEIEDILIDIL